MTDLNLVVTLGGVPVKNQADGVQAFKDACNPTRYPPQKGTWTLVAPDGRIWQADSPLAVVGKEQRERIPPSLALERIYRAMYDEGSTLGKEGGQ
jgi:hypothetical protein